jgi:phospholipid/cholesterol/gamma-HCH transport system substrate-binding protein
MTTKALKIRVGLFVAVTVSLLVAVLVVFGGLRFWEKHASYRIVFAGSVMGLEKGATVYFNGIKVGRVDEITLSPQDLSNVEVEISVKRETPIHADTKALLAMAGITGLKVVDLRDGSRTAPRLEEGGLIAQGETTLDKFEKQAKDIADTSAELMKRANKIVDNLVTLTDPAKYQAIEEILDQTRKTSQNLALASGSLGTMIAENRTALKTTLASVQETAHSASTMLDGPIAGLIGNAGDFVADLKNLIRNNEGQLRSAVFDLRQASRSFKELARDVRLRPSRLLFSSDPGERKLP